MVFSMLESLDGPSFGASKGFCYAFELGWPFVKIFSWPLLCFGAWIGPRWELFMALAILRSLHGSLLGVSHGPFYDCELEWPFVWRFSWPLLCLGAWMSLR